MTWGRLYGDFQTGLKFQLVKRVEILSRLNSKFLFEMTLQLHVKVSARYGELKFQFGLARSEESSYLLNNLGQQLTSFHPTIHQ